MSKTCWENLKNVRHFSENLLKWVWKGPPGLSTSQDESKLCSESNGMPPGAQNPEKRQKIKKIRENPLIYTQTPGQPPLAAVIGRLSA